MRSLPNIRRLLLVAVVLPAVIVLADYTAFQIAEASNWAPPQTLLLCVVFVVQIGLIGVLVGRLLDRWTWRLGVYVWALVVTDLWLFGLTAGHSGRGPTTLSFALVAAQIGALATWLVLGPPPWQWRLPVVVLTAIPLGFLFLSRGHSTAWITILSIQTVGLLTALVALRAARFRIVTSEASKSRPNAIPQHQFSMMQMLFWSTVVAISLVALKAMDIQTFEMGNSVDWITHITLGAILTVVPLTAIWAALTRRHLALRFTVLFVAAIAMGAAARWFIRYVDQYASSRMVWSWWSLEKLDWLWIAWTCLVAGFLAAILLLLRTTGYRLVRETKPMRPPPP